MAVNLAHVYFLFVFIHNLISITAVEKRFSDYKRCADEECSMLLCRGKASNDFMGPDCRFLSFKKGETIYVYYKLSGKRTDVWAGSVGNRFGYFHKDLLTINHIYTEKELEIPAVETDFVCFDTGFDKFDSYDIDSLLDSSLSSDLEEPVQGTTDEIDLNKSAESTLGDLDEPPPEETPLEKKEMFLSDVHEGIEKVVENIKDQVVEVIPDQLVEKEDMSLLKSVHLDKPPHEETQLERKQMFHNVVPEDIDKVVDNVKDQVVEVIPDQLVEKEDLSLLKSVHLDKPPHEQTQLERKQMFHTDVSEDIDKVVDNVKDQVVEVIPDQLVEKEDLSHLQTVDLDKPPSEVTPLQKKEIFHKDVPNNIDKDVEDDLEKDVLEKTKEEEGLSKFKPMDLDEHSPEVTPLQKTEMFSSDVLEKIDKDVEVDLEKDGADHLAEEEDLSLVKPVDSDDPPPKLTVLEEKLLINDVSEDIDKVENVDLEKDVPDKHEEEEDLSILGFDEMDLDEPPSKFNLLGKNEMLLNESGSVDATGPVEDPVPKVVPTAEGIKGDVQKDQLRAEPSVPDSFIYPDKGNIKDVLSEALSKDPDLDSTADISSEGRPVPELKTTLGTTFDAVTTDDEVTRKVTLYNEEDKEADEIEYQQDVDNDLRQTPLLGFTEEHTHVKHRSIPELDQIDEEYSLSELAKKQDTKSKNPWSSVGDTVFNILSGGKRTAPVPSSEEDEDDDDDEEEDDDGENAPQEPPKIEEYKGNIQILAHNSKPEPDPTEQSQKLAVETPVTEELPVQKESRDFSQVENTFNLGDTELFREPNTLEELTKNTIAAETSTEMPTDYEDMIDSEDIEEDLLEDENALSSLTHDTDIESENEFGSEQPNNDAEVVSIDEKDVVQNGEAIDVEPVEYNTEKDSESTDIDKNHEHVLEDNYPDLLPVKEPEYSDDVLRLTLLRHHFEEEEMERFQKVLGLQNLFRLELLFSDLEQELKAAWQSQSSTSEDIEKALETILEASETPILDEVEMMLDAQDYAGQQQETGELDEEATILDNFQELAFTLRQKYSAASDSAPLAARGQPDLHPDSDKETSNDLGEENTFPDILEDTDEDNVTLPEEREEMGAAEEMIAHEEGHDRPDKGIEEDVGHFNRNKDNQLSFKKPEDIQRGPQPILENTFDMGLVDMEHPSSGHSESASRSDFQAEEQSGSSFASVVIFSGNLITLVYEYLGTYTVMMAQSLPEEWRPGPDFHGWPWEPVMVTLSAGLVALLFVFWSSMSIKNKSYLTSQKEIIARMKMMEQEKEDIIQKVSELQRQGEELKEQHERSQKNSTSSLQKVQELESLVQEMDKRNVLLEEEKNLLAKSLHEEQTKTVQHEDVISELNKTMEKLKHSRKKTQDALSKATMRVDEAVLREEARNAQHQALEKDIASLRKENLSLHQAAKSMEEKRTKMSEQIRAHQRSQKELEDSLAQKDHNIEVLSDLLGDLEACDGGLTTRDITADKQDAIRNRIKQMMDVSRVQTTLSVVEEERDRFMTKLLNEEKARKVLEEQYQKLEHDILLVKSDKNYLENQFETLKQKNEIMTEMYQQKENALQQKLTKEEFERRNKEEQLSEVGGKALEAEEEIKVCRQRIRDIQEELKQTEKSYKAQIIEQEQKSHENWVLARAAERALFDEKKETTNLRERLMEMSTRLNELRRPLFKPTPGMAPMPGRRGDSYGPSPVSGGAPSPPLMIEGPGRPPSAPVGRRNDPYGPRPPSDPQGRYLPEQSHLVASRPDPTVPRTSSPSNPDSSRCGPQDPGSLLVSPISSSSDAGADPLPRHPSGLSYRPPLGHGPHQLPPPGPGPFFYRQPNGPPGMMPSGPPPRIGHPPGPLIPPGQWRPPQYGPPPANGHPPGPLNQSGQRPLPPGPYGPMPPHYGIRGGPPMGPPRPYAHYGPRDPSVPPQRLPPGAASSYHQGGPTHQPQAPQSNDSSVAPQGQGQDYTSQQVAAATLQPQDSGNSSMGEP
ncbi:hypothetical protein UPYG_G00275120 [Umbra pygmaea]|uniref:Transport and Golgi organization protein 1 homolog n=1 Tax=Umbra pygmaea TaxID=75934 RepID=A0ABD0WMR7_UMBPY